MKTAASNLLLAALGGMHAVQADTLPPPGSNPLTWGLYSTHEMQTPAQLEVQGTIPEWLSGSLYRGAAATWDVGNYTAEHWFDGFSRNHMFEFADGRVSYRSRNGSDELREFVRETGLYPDGSFGSDPCKIVYGAHELTYRDGNNSVGSKSARSVPVAYIPNFPGLERNSSSRGGVFDTLVTTTDANELQQLDPVTLEPIELFTYRASHPLLDNGGRTSAHPAVGEDGIFNYLLDVGVQPPVYRVFGIMHPDGETKILANIDDAPPAYIHALFSTEKHIVLVVWQADLTEDGKSLLGRIGEWDPERKTLFYVIDRVNGGVVSKYISEEAFFGLHEINSFEDTNGDILVDLPRMDNTSFLEAARMVNLRANIADPTNGSAMNDLIGSFTRYRLPFQGAAARASNGSLVTHKATVDFSLPRAEAGTELPAINPAHRGKPYRYAYGIHVEQTGSFADSIIKFDTQAREWTVWAPETKHLPSEPVFVPTPGAEREDDGVLLFVAMDAEFKRSAMVVLNATTMEELGRARMPIVMGYGFHGAWGAM